MHTGNAKRTAVCNASGSCKARISLIKSIPTLAASCITSALELSTEIQQSNRFLTASTKGITRSSSSSNVTSSAIGRVDSPPMSIIDAPCFNIASTWNNALSNWKNLPLSEKESGVKLRIPIILGVERSSVLLFAVNFIDYSLTV